jgi:antitoxin component HigA of HigAB toxin-antitoxin module
MEIEIPDEALSDELKALFNNAPALTAENEKELAEAVKTVQQDPKFQAELMKARVVEAVLAEMDARNMNRNQLAQKWGKSRQYVGRILDENRKANFTLETISELLQLFGKRMEIQIRDLVPAEAFKTREPILTETLSPTCRQSFWLQNAPRNKRDGLNLNTTNLKMAESNGERDILTA